MKLISVLAELADVLDVLYTTTAPNGNITARQNRLAFYDNSGVYSLWVNLDGVTAWAGISGELSPGAEAGSKITDADGDTAVETEKNADEDKVRIKTGGTEALVIDDSQDLYMTSGKKIALDGSTKQFFSNYDAASGYTNFYVNGSLRMQI